MNSDTKTKKPHHRVVLEIPANGEPRFVQVPSKKKLFSVPERILLYKEGIPKNGAPKPWLQHGLVTTCNEESAKRVLKDPTKWSSWVFLEFDELGRLTKLRENKNLPFFVGDVYVTCTYENGAAGAFVPASLPKGKSAKAWMETIVAKLKERQLAHERYIARMRADPDVHIVEMP